MTSLIVFSHCLFEPLFEEMSAGNLCPMWVWVNVVVFGKARKETTASQWWFRVVCSGRTDVSTEIFSEIKVRSVACVKKGFTTVMFVNKFLQYIKFVFTYYYNRFTNVFCFVYFTDIEYNIFTVKCKKLRR